MLPYPTYGLCYPAFPGRYSSSQEGYCNPENSLYPGSRGLEDHPDSHRLTGGPHAMPVKIGYASGVYDLFHIGHLNLLRQARERCDFLIAGVASADMSRRLKGITPVVPLTERLEIVRGIRFVDEAVVDEHVNKAQTWREVGFNVFFKGNDWQGTQKGIDIETKFAAVGVQVTYFPYTVHTSSTVLRRTLERLTSGGDALSGPPGAQA